MLYNGGVAQDLTSYEAQNYVIVKPDGESSYFVYSDNDGNGKIEEATGDFVTSGSTIHQAYFKAVLGN